MKLTLPILLLTLCLMGCQNVTDAPKSGHSPLVSCMALCDFDGPNSHISTGIHEGKVYFNKNIVSTKDSVVISFDFTETCCLDFNGLWEIENDVLYLSYDQKDSTNLGCECKCDYRMKFIFDPELHSWRRVRIVRGL